MGTTAEPAKRAAGTVYEGPALPVENPWAGNRYVGAKSAPSTNAKAPVKETVFDETTFVPKKTDNTVAVAATRNKARRASLRFFLVACVSCVEALLWFSQDLPLLAISAGIVAAFFAILGIFAFRMSKTAFLTGAIIYALSTIYLLLNWNFLMLYAIIIHCLIVWRLYCMYGMIRELETE